MQYFNRPITEIIDKRFSCRIYREEPISHDIQNRIKDYLTSMKSGPLGAPVRFELVAATEEDRSSLNGLGTYGFIKGATGFVVGAMGSHPMDLEDYGYAFEQIILYLTDLDLGTCWLGGTFTKSNFAKKISLTEEERLPAAISIGLIADQAMDKESHKRKKANTNNRLGWEDLFFEGRFGNPLASERAGGFAVPLEMVRRAPSASNNQPWRIVKEGRVLHFYLRRTQGYYESLPFKVLRLADLQRVDLGIAMAHFELTARELGLAGRWIIAEPDISKPDDLTEYSITWEASGLYTA